MTKYVVSFQNGVKNSSLPFQVNCNVEIWWEFTKNGTGHCTSKQLYGVYTLDKMVDVKDKVQKDRVLNLVDVYDIAADIGKVGSLTRKEGSENL